jgi:hypothetical protein
MTSQTFFVVLLASLCSLVTALPFPNVTNVIGVGFKSRNASAILPLAISIDARVIALGGDVGEVGYCVKDQFIVDVIVGSSCENSTEGRNCDEGFSMQQYFTGTSGDLIAGFITANLMLSDPLSHCNVSANTHVCSVARQSSGCSGMDVNTATFDKQGLLVSFTQGNCH